MVETRDFEVCTVELEQLNQDVIEAFAESRIRHLVLLNEGRYAGVIDVTELKKNGRWMTSSIQAEQCFPNARAFFSKYENRNQLIALLDGAGNLLTFLVWNQREEVREEILSENREKLIQLLEKGYDIVFENWDEYTDAYINFCEEKYGYADHIFLTGRNWEICGYDQKYKYISQISKEMIVISKKGISYPQEEPMVHSFFRMKEEYKHKALYFHLGSMGYLFDIGFVCRPDGYCEMREYREIDSFMGLEVLDLEEIGKRPDAAIIVQNQYDVDYLEKRIAASEIVLYWDMFEYDDVIGKEVFQGWGTEAEWKRFRKNMAKVRIPYQNLKDNNEWNGVLLWEAVLHRSSAGFKEYMKQINPDVKLYARNHVFETTGVQSMCLRHRSIDTAIRNNRKIIIYGVRSHYTNRWIHFLERRNLKFELMEEAEGEWHGYSLGCIYDLPFYDLEDVFVIINQPYGEFARAVKLLNDYGISLERHNCVSIYEQILQQDRGGNMIDTCSGWVCEKLANANIPCYWTFGEDDSSDYKILVVGGSTTADCFVQYHTWAEELHGIFKRAGKKVTIYNGGVEAYASMQELSKVMRDIRILKPDMVISFSGLNDAAYCNTNEGYVNGAAEKGLDDKFKYWIENEKMMAYVAKENNAKFFCFAQPQYYLNEKMDLYGRLFTIALRYKDKKTVEFDWNRKVRELKDYPWLIDLSDIMEGRDDLFFDDCHVISEGNRWIAEHIYKHIKDDVR